MTITKESTYWINKRTGRYYRETKGMARKLCLSQVEGTASGMLVFDSEDEARTKGWEKTDSLKSFLREQYSKEDSDKDTQGTHERV